MSRLSTTSILWAFSLIAIVTGLVLIARWAVWVRKKIADVRTARELGSWVVYDFQMDRCQGEWLIHCEDTWLTRLFRPHLFGEIEYVAMSPDFSVDRTPCDADVAFLATSFPRLRGLLLEGGGFGDDACASISHMAFLEKLWLIRTEVTERGLQHLKKLNTLTEVGISESEVSDGALAELASALPNCTVNVNDGQKGNRKKTY